MALTPNKLSYHHMLTVGDPAGYMRIVTASGVNLNIWLKRALEGSESLRDIWISGVFSHTLLYVSWRDRHIVSYKQGTVYFNGKPWRIPGEVKVSVANAYSATANIRAMEIFDAFLEAIDGRLIPEESLLEACEEVKNYVALESSLDTLKEKVRRPATYRTRSGILNFIHSL